ncbi:hypothetical protein BJX76DRAFT_355100 [Aspergillus varians]
MTIVTEGGSVSFTSTTSNGSRSRSNPRSRSRRRGRYRPGPRGPTRAGTNPANNSQDRGRGQWGRQNTRQSQNRGGSPGVGARDGARDGAGPGPNPVNLDVDARAVSPSGIDTTEAARTAFPAHLPGLVSVPGAGAGAGAVGYRTGGNGGGSGNGGYDHYDAYHGTIQEGELPALDAPSAHYYADSHPGYESDEWRITTGGGVFNRVQDFDVSEDPVGGEGGGCLQRDLMDFTENGSTGTI